MGRSEFGHAAGCVRYRTVSLQLPPQRLVPPVSIPVAVVVPTANGGKYFPRLKASLLSQDAAEVIIVIDDASDVAEVEAAFDGLANLKVLRTPGQIGAGPARNLGVRASTQPWVAFLDVDDWWPENFLHELFDRVTASVVGYDNQLWSEVNGSEPIPLHTSTFERSRWDLSSIDRASSRQLLSGFPLVKVVVRRSAFDAVGGFRQIYAVEDFDILWRLIAHGERVQLLREPTGNYLLHSASTTRTVQSDQLAWERAQRSWIKIWGAMALSNGMPPAVRMICFRSLLLAVGRLASSVTRRAVLR